MTDSKTARLSATVGGSYARAILLTTGLLYLTVLLGVSTRATGAGLACNANWPLCDGGLLNLFPASLPSAFEWIHRVVAMLAGFAVLGAALLTWRSRAPQAVTVAVGLGTVLLPVQVLLGRETVLTFTPPVLAAHYWVAMVIYGSFVFAAIRTHPGSHSFANVRRALLLATATVPVAVLLGPPVVTRYSAPIQATQYVFVLLAFAALLFATVVGRGRGPSHRGFGWLLLAGTALLPVVVALMRQRIIHPDSAIATLHPIGAVLLVASVFGATLWVLAAGDRDSARTGV